MAIGKWLATALIFTALLAVSFADDSNQSVQDTNSIADDFNSVLPDINSGTADFNSWEGVDLNASANTDMNAGGPDLNAEIPDLNQGVPDLNAQSPDLNTELPDLNVDDGNAGTTVPDLNLPQGDGEVIADSNGLIEDINEFVDDIIDKVKEIIDPIVEDVGETITGIVVRQSVVNIEGKSARCIGVKCHDLAYETGGTLDDLIVIPKGESIGNRNDDENPDLNSEIPDLNSGMPIDANSEVDLNGTFDGNGNIDVNSGNVPDWNLDGEQPPEFRTSTLARIPTLAGSLRQILIRAMHLKRIPEIRIPMLMRMAQEIHNGDAFGCA